VAGALSWRWAFAVLAAPAAVLAVLIWRSLPEPRRGGQSRQPAERRETAAQRAVRDHRVGPVSEKVLRCPAAELRLPQALRYVLSISTVRWLIAASAIGYFFFAGMRTFALVFVRGQFSLNQAGGTAILFIAGLGSLAGVLVAGRLADRLLRRGVLTARVLVGAVSYLAAVVFLAPSLLVGSVAAGVPLLFLAGAGLSAPNPPLDAARLDIMPSGLWGRAEGVRTLVRQTAQAGAPLLFGLLADAFGGASGAGAAHEVSAASTRALRYTFLLMLVPLALNGLLLLGARRRYPGDVATAAVSERNTSARR
jgi:sugar phosphate permease